MQVRCLLEGVPVDDILADWHGLLQEYMQRWQLDRSKVHTSMCAWFSQFCLNPVKPAACGAASG